MTSSTKPEVGYITCYNAARERPSHGRIQKNFEEVRPCSFQVMQTVRQTDRQTNGHTQHYTSRPSRGRSIIIYRTLTEILLVHAASLTCIFGRSQQIMHMNFHRATLCLARYMPSSCVCLSVCLCVCLCVSVTLRYCIKTAKHRITQITPHDSPGF